MSNNFLQWNPAAVNQQTDGTYSVDTMRTGGAVTGIFPADLANKLFYQCSTMVAAFGEALSNKGYAVSDANIATLITLLANVLTKADFGTASGTVCQGDDSRLSNARTPVSHAVDAPIYGYGDTTNAGHLRVGTGLTVSTGTVSALFGTTAGSVCQGNDSRLGVELPTGTKMWFYQNTAPSGWVIDATPADAILAVKGGSNAYNTTGGTQAGTWTQPTHLHTTGDHTLSAAESGLPAHVHYVYGTGTHPEMYGGGGFAGDGNTTGANTQANSAQAASQAHNHGNTGSSNTANTWRPLAQVGIICTKS